MRLANITATTLPHRAITDSNLLGFEIKKDYTLLPNLKSVHMDKEHWGDPEVFRPERFIDENGQFVDDSWMIPFGLGNYMFNSFNFHALRLKFILKVFFLILLN